MSIKSLTHKQKRVQQFTRQIDYEVSRERNNDGRQGRGQNNFPAGLRSLHPLADGQN